MNTANKLSSVAIFVPYFGKLPNYFPLWLRSCRYNPTIDWFIFTDDQTPFDYPPNVHVEYKSFEDTRSTFQQHYKFAVALHKDAHKLCDFKVAYGDIFSGYCRGYDFWGYCDIDLVFGNIRNFITEDILNNHDRIFSLGHLSLFRNTDRITHLYRNTINGEPAFEKVFSSAKHYAFDERGPFTIQAICLENGIRVYEEIVYADLRIETHHFELTHRHIDPREQRRECTIFRFQRGTLARLYIENNQLEQKEYLYVHLQSRLMALYLSNTSPETFLIVPNKFIDYDVMIDIEIVRNHGRYRGMYFHNVVKVWKARARTTCGRLRRSICGR